MPRYKSGTIINNRYEVVQGPNEKPSLAGSMGLVYLCVDHAEDGKPVALKTFRPELLSDRAARNRFLREGTTWVELGKHPHIVHCYQVFNANFSSEVFFALELVAAAKGKRDASLRSWLIPNEPMPLEQALLFALNICRGMVHATTMIPGLVHRDLKPENILIGQDGRARVTDFGLASAAQNLSSNWQLNNDKSLSQFRTQLTRGIAGTPLYMAPEQWTGEPLDERADIYAFGCILYEMICGSYAVTGRSIQELKQAHRQGQVNPIPARVPSVLNGLLQCCLALAAANRYHDWTKLETDLTTAYVIISGKSLPAILARENDIPTERIAVGWSYNAIGVSYLEIGKFEVARDYFEKVLSIAWHHSDRFLAGAALGNLGIACGQLGDARRAIEFFEEHLAVAQEIGDPYGEEQALGNLGNAYCQLGDVNHAIEFQQKRLAIARNIGDRHGQGRALGNLGTAYLKLGDARRAIEFYEGHLAIAREIGNRHDEGQLLGNLGTAYVQLGDVLCAIEFYEKHLAIAREIGDRHGEGQAMGNIGNAYYQLGDARCAIEFHDKRLAIAREIGDRHGEGQALGNLGTAYVQLGDPQRAIKLFEQCLRIVREIGDPQYEATTLGCLGYAYFQQGDARSAIEFQEKRLAIARKIGDRRSEGQALGALGVAYHQLGDALREIAFYEQALTVAWEIKDIINIAETSFNMATHYQQDNPSKALDYAREAFRLFTQIGHREHAEKTQVLIDEIHG